MMEATRHEDQPASEPRESTPPNEAAVVRPRRRARKPVNCLPCRTSKVRCDRRLPCEACTRRGCVDACRFTGTSPSPPIGEATTLLPHGQEHNEGQSAQPPGPRPEQDHATLETNQSSQAFTHNQWEEVLQRPIDQIGQSQYDPSSLFTQPENICFPFSLGPKVSKNELLSALPPARSCEYLITQYFVRLAPFFHILHGPSFQKEYKAFQEDPSAVELSWLALLFLICSVTINTMDDYDAVLGDLVSNSPRSHDSLDISHQYRIMAMVCLCQDNFLVRHRLSTLEALLVLIYTVSHNEGVERCWVMLGMALNTAIALKCNATKPYPELNCVEVQRRRRCWAGLLMLHTYQAILYRDVDMSFLINIDAVMPADVNDNDITEDGVFQTSTQPTQMSAMIFKIRLFRLSNKICQSIENLSQLDEILLGNLDAEVSEEQRQWDSVFLVDGSPSLLDTSSYAHWCVLQLYAHQLYLLLHRPFSHPQPTNGRSYLAASREKCIASGAALLDIHRQLVELPRLRHYRWYAQGMSGFCAFHGAVALASCLLAGDSEEFAPCSYRAIFDGAVLRIGLLQNKSPICVKAYPILGHLQSLLSPSQFQWSDSAGQEFGYSFDNWIDTIQWLNPDSVNWDVWDSVLNG